MKYIHIISATDSSGGAGMQQDIVTASALGYWPVSTVSGITAQSFEKVYDSVSAPDGIFKRQIELALDYKVSAIKIGALFSMEQLQLVHSCIRRCRNTPVILDPVFGPTGGRSFYTDEMIEYVRTTILKDIDVITPNKNEIELICGRSFDSIHDAAVFIEKHKRCGQVWCLTGGHFTTDYCTEAIIDTGITYVTKRREHFTYSHGTGCMLSTALACFIGRKIKPITAYKKATRMVSRRYRLYTRRLYSNRFFLRR